MSDDDNEIPPIPVFYDGPIIRVPDWETDWYAFIDEYQSLDHEWGTTDCVHFAMKNVGTLIGADITSMHLGKYTTQLGAFKYLKTIGYLHVHELPASFLPETHMADASRGDVVLFDDCLGVNYGSVGLFMGEEGFTSIPLRECERVWKVG